MSQPTEIPAVEPAMPACISCGSARGPWRPTGDRYPSGAQVLACATPCGPEAKPAAPASGTLPVRQKCTPGELKLLDEWMHDHGDDPAEWPERVRLAYANTVAHARARGTL